MPEIPPQLVLTRGHLQAISILDAAGAEIARMTVVGFTPGGRVKLAIAAGPDITIARAEIAGIWTPRQFQNGANVARTSEQRE